MPGQWDKLCYLTVRLSIRNHRKHVWFIATISSCGTEESRVGHLKGNVGSCSSTSVRDPVMLKSQFQYFCILFDMLLLWGVGKSFLWGGVVMFAKRGRLINQYCVGLIWATGEEQKGHCKHEYYILRQRPLDIWKSNAFYMYFASRERRSNFAEINGKSKYLQTIHKRFSYSVIQWLLRWLFSALMNGDIDWKI